MALQVYVKKLRELPQLRFEEESRGYRKDQVDKVLAYLAPLADEIEALQKQLTEAEARAASAESEVVDLTARAERAEATARSAQASQPAAAAAPTAQPAQPVAPAPQAPTPVAPAPAVAPTTDYDETLRNTLLLAERTATARVDEANTEAARLVAEAQAEAEELRVATAEERARTEAEVAAERATLLAAARDDVAARISQAEAQLAEAEVAERERLKGQIASLTTRRDELATDVETFEAYLSERRELLRATLVDLVDVVEDPTKLRASMPPVATAAEPLPADVDSPPVVTVAALDQLDIGGTGATMAADPSPAPTAEAVATAPSVPESVAVDTPIVGATSTEADDAAIGSVAEELGYTQGVDLPTEAVPMIDVDDESVSRPAWADSVPSLDEDVAEDTSGGDPFLDELRRATTEDDDSDEDLASFFDGDDDKKSGWFGRRPK